MLSKSGFFNDGSDDAPKLKVFMNLDTLVDLRADTCWRGARIDRPFPVHIERLRRSVVEEQLAARHCSRDQRCRNRLAVNDLEILHAFHKVSLLPGSGLVRTQ